MAKTGLTAKLNKSLLNEWRAFESVKKTPHYVAFQRSQAVLHNDLKEIGKSGDPELIIKSERMLIQNEKARYENSPEMNTSLNNAMSEADAALKTYGKINNPDEYKTLAEGYTSHKSLKGSLPNDETRQFFSSQSARILNLGKGRYSDEEKAMYKTRRQNLNKANKTYINMQKQALGQDQDTTQKSKRKDNEDGFEL